MENDRQLARRLLQEAGIEIDLSDHRSAVEVAHTFGLIGINGANDQQLQDEMAQPVVRASGKYSPYLAH